MENIVAIADEKPTAANIRKHAEIVREDSMRWQIAAITNEMAEAANHRLQHPAQLLNDASEKLFRLDEAHARGYGLRKVDHIITAAVERIDMLYSRGGDNVVGVPSGFADLDASCRALCTVS